MIDSWPSTARPGRRQTANAAKVLEAAAKVFSERGFAATSLDDIADALGSSKGRIYHYFRTKGDLFVGIYERVLASVLDAVTSVDVDVDPGARLHEMVRRHMVYNAEHADFIGLEQHRGEFAAACERQRSGDTALGIVELQRDLHTAYRQVIAEGIDVGEFLDDDPDILASSVMGSIDSMFVWLCRAPDRKDPIANPDRLAATIADFAVRAVRVR